MKTRIFIVTIITIIMLNPAGSAISDSDGTVDHSQFANLLGRYVENGVVDYAGFKKEEDLLDQYLETLQSVKPGDLNRDEQFAFYVNAYNAWTIKLILTRYPDIKSIKDLGSIFKSPWKKKFVHIDGRITTLDEIEHGILRPGFKDPRVHFAVNCASRGCPPLLSQPYTGKDLDRQLDGAAAQFINNPEFNRIQGNTLYASKIFKWFSEDFNEDAVAFFTKYAEGNLKAALKQNSKNLKIKYLDYDWSLNGH